MVADSVEALAATPLALALLADGAILHLAIGPTVEAPVLAIER